MALRDDPETRLALAVVQQAYRDLPSWLFALWLKSNTGLYWLELAGAGDPFAMADAIIRQDAA